VRRRRLNTSVVRILLMVPIYSITSWLGLRFPEAALYLRTARECYEALAMYSFFIMLILVLGGHAPLVRLLEQQPPQEHLWPFCHLKPFEPGRHFLWHTEFGTLQFVVLKPILSLISFICSAVGVYGEGRFSYNVAYPYISFITSVSQMYALYALILFYFAVKDELQPVRPVPKFMAIKMIIFFTYWQGVLVAILLDYGWIQDNDKYSAFNVASQLQEFLVCVEMFFFALFHIIAFKPEDFDHVVVARPRRRRRLNAQQMIVHHHHHHHHVAIPTGGQAPAEIEMQSNSRPSYDSLTEYNTGHVSHYGQKQLSNHRHHHHHHGTPTPQASPQDIAVDFSSIERATERASATTRALPARKTRQLQSHRGHYGSDRRGSTSSFPFGHPYEDAFFDSDEMARANQEEGEGYYMSKQKLKSSQQYIDSDDEDLYDDDNMIDDFGIDTAEYEDDEDYDQEDEEDLEHITDSRPIMQRDAARSDEPMIRSQNYHLQAQHSIAQSRQSSSQVTRSTRAGRSTPSKPQLPAYMLPAVPPSARRPSGDVSRISKTVSATGRGGTVRSQPTSTTLQSQTPQVMSPPPAARPVEHTTASAVPVRVSKLLEAPEAITNPPSAIPAAQVIVAQSQSLTTGLPQSTASHLIPTLQQPTPTDIPLQQQQGATAVAAGPAFPGTAHEDTHVEEDDLYFDEFEEEEDDFDDEETSDDNNKRRLHSQTIVDQRALPSAEAVSPGAAVASSSSTGPAPGDSSSATTTQSSPVAEGILQEEQISRTSITDPAASFDQSTATASTDTTEANQSLGTLPASSPTTGSKKKSRERRPPHPLRYLYDAVNVSDIARDAQSVYVRREAAGRRKTQRTQEPPPLTVSTTTPVPSGSPEAPDSSQPSGSPQPTSASVLPDVSALSLQLARSPSSPLATTSAAEASSKTSPENDASRATQNSSEPTSETRGEGQDSAAPSNNPAKDPVTGVIEDYA